MNDAELNNKRMNSGHMNSMLRRDDCPERSLKVGRGVINKKAVMKIVWK